MKKIFRIKSDVLISAENGMEAVAEFACFLIAATECEDEEEMPSDTIVDGVVEVKLLQRDS